MSGPFAKDCGCVTHDGPHWLHMQLLDRAALGRLVEGKQSVPPALEHHLYSEAARLEGELATEMDRRGIDVLPAAVIQRVRDSHRAWVESLRCKREAENRADAARRARQKKVDEARLAEIAAEYDTATDARRREIESESAELQRNWWT